MGLFPMERLIEMLGESVAEGRDVEEIVAEFVEAGLCSLEEASQLREQFMSSAPPPSVESSQPIADGSPATAQPEPQTSSLRPEPLVSPGPSSPPESPSARPDLVLHIDWGMELRPGVNLLPKFTIRGGSLPCPPLVYFPVDSRIPQKDWKLLPPLKRSPEGWSFDQPFRLEEGGHYKIRIVVIDPSPGFADPGYYHSDFRIEVPDPKEAGQRRKVKIQADDNLVANLDRFGKDADIEIVGGSVTLLARDESPVGTSDKVSIEETPIWMTTLPFQFESDSARNLPYLSRPNVPEPVSRLVMSESGMKRIALIGGRRLGFGRDVSEELCWNDVSLEVLPGTSDEKTYANEFALLNKLFSREHARLEVGKMGVFLADVRQGGILDATILDGEALGKGCESLLFSHEGNSAASRTVLFSKLLAMQLTPYYEIFWEELLRKNLPEPLPQRLLNSLYALESSTGLSSICIRPERYFKQKPHAETLLKILKSTPLAASDWWKKWFAGAANVDPRHGTHEYWFVPLFVTLGRDRNSAIKLENRQWNDVRLRILTINDSLFIENVSCRFDVQCGFQENLFPLPPFRPHPLFSGSFVQKGGAVLRFE